MNKVLSEESNVLLVCIKREQCLPFCLEPQITLHTTWCWWKISVIQHRLTILYKALEKSIMYFIFRYKIHAHVYNYIHLQLSKRGISCAWHCRVHENWMIKPDATMDEFPRRKRQIAQGNITGNVHSEHENIQRIFTWPHDFNSKYFI